MIRPLEITKKLNLVAEFVEHSKFFNIVVNDDLLNWIRTDLKASIACAKIYKILLTDELESKLLNCVMPEIHKYALVRTAFWPEYVSKIDQYVKSVVYPNLLYYSDYYLKFNIFNCEKTDKLIMYKYQRNETIFDGILAYANLSHTKISPIFIDCLKSDDKNRYLKSIISNRMCNTRANRDYYI
jgi:hypothetical protein